MSLCKTGKRSSGCPEYKLFALIGKKWNVHILVLISQGEDTFTGIKEALGDLNSSILTQRLDELASEGLIEKHIISEKPRTIRYSISPIGKEVVKVFESLKEVSGKLYK